MASIKKRGNTYKVEVYKGKDITGKRVFESATFVPDPNRTDRQNEKALRQFADDFEKKVKNGLSRGDALTLQAFAEQWLAVYGAENLEATTLNKYRTHLALIYPRIGMMKLSDIRPMTIQDLLHDLRVSGYRMKNGRRKEYSEDTLRGIRITLSSILSAAVEDGIITSNPCMVRKRKQKRDREEKVINAWTPEEASFFLERICKPIDVIVPEHKAKRGGTEIIIREYTGRPIIVPTKYRCFYTLSIYSGCRRGELVALTWNDVDLTKGTINIRRSAHYTPESGQYDGSTKTVQSRRELYLPSTAIQTLREWKREQAREILLLGSAWTGDRTQTTGYVFTQETGEQINIGTPGHEFNRFVKAINANIPEEENKLPVIRLHDLRHTSASICIAAGLDPVAVAHRLGHSDATTTLRIYSHSFAENDKAAADILEAAISSSGNMKRQKEQAAE